jgi:quercetin dioxygenase-like cupin family protein
MLAFALIALLQAPVDNDWVRIVHARNIPGQKSRLHKHDRNRVMVHLDAGHMRLAYQDGAVKDVRFRAGEVRWDPAGGLHTSETVGPGSYRIVEIELKRSPGVPPQPSPLDPVKVDPRHYAVELDNDQVRVIRARYGPRDAAPMHEHALPRVTVNLTDQAVRLTVPDGSNSELRRSAGEVVFTPTPARHSEVNLADQPFEVILVEIKTK